MGLGLGSVRGKVIVSFIMIILVWQCVKHWSPPVEDREISQEIQAMEDAEKGEVKPSVKSQTVLIGVYYEALCPDSRSFVVKQLEPTYRALNENVEIQMVPYGKATTKETDDGFEFTCQHGPPECEANMIHACAIDFIKDPSVQLDFLACMIKNNLNPQNITRVCGAKMQIDVKPILDCQKERKGQELLAKYGKMTNNLSPEVSFIPTITLDKNSDNQPAILKNLREQVCRLFTVAPQGCT